jgi:hypothetical protein
MAGLQKRTTASRLTVALGLVAAAPSLLAATTSSPTAAPATSCSRDRSEPERNIPTPPPDERPTTNTGRAHPPCITSTGTPLPGGTSNALPQPDGTSNASPEPGGTSSATPLPDGNSKAVPEPGETSSATPQPGRTSNAAPELPAAKSAEAPASSVRPATTSFAPKRLTGEPSSRTWPIGSIVLILAGAVVAALTLLRRPRR